MILIWNRYTNYNRFREMLMEVTTCWRFHLTAESWTERPMKPDTPHLIRCLYNLELYGQYATGSMVCTPRIQPTSMGLCQSGSRPRDCAAHQRKPPTDTNIRHWVHARQFCKPPILRVKDPIPGCFRSGLLIVSRSERQSSLRLSLTKTMLTQEYHDNWIHLALRYSWKIGNEGHRFERPGG